MGRRAQQQQLTTAGFLLWEPKIRFLVTYGETDFGLRNFPVDEEVANLLRTCYGEIGVMDFGLKCVYSNSVFRLIFSSRMS